MKSHWFFILLGVILFGCCAASENNSNEGSLVKKNLIHYHHTENCGGHELLMQKIVFMDEGHEMWLYCANGKFVGIDHSPDCEKCHPKATSLLEEKEEEKSDYWGW